MHALITEWTARDPGSYLARSMLGDAWPWGMTEQLLAELVDVGRLHLWAAHGQENDRPSPIPRPGVDTPHEPDGLFGMAVAQGFNPEQALDPREWLGW